MGLNGSNFILIREAQNWWDIYFGSELESSTGSQVTDITLNGHDPVLPKAAKMTLIVPKGGFEGALLRGSKLFCFAWPLECQVIKEVLGSQSLARQCMVAAILHRSGAESSASIESAYSN